MKKFLGVLIAIGLAGCSTMFGDNARQVRVNSEPEGAQVYFNGNSYGTTPTIITLPNYIYGPNTLTVKKDGFYDQSTNINTNFQMVGLWNILNFPIGFAIDAADGNILKLDPNQQNMNLVLKTKK